MPAPWKRLHGGKQASAADPTSEAGAASEANGDEAPDAPRSKRARILILIALFVALGGLELIGGILLLAGYAVVSLFRGDGADNEKPDAAPVQQEQREH